MTDLYQFVLANKTELLAAFAALNVFAALVAKITPNKTDDQLVAKLAKVLDLLTLSTRKK
jgi:hypothetical protein